MPSPNVTITGVLDASSGAVEAGWVTFTLVNYGLNVPKVTGTAIVVDLQMKAQANGSGAFSQVLWGNNQISPANTYYAVQFFSALGNPSEVQIYSFVGSGTFDISTLTPVPPNPVPIITPVGGLMQLTFNVPTQFTITGSPATGNGVLTLGLQTQSANTVFAGPATGSPATPTFRALTSTDLAVFVAPGATNDLILNVGGVFATATAAGNVLQFLPTFGQLVIQGTQGGIYFGNPATASFMAQLSGMSISDVTNGVVYLGFRNETHMFTFNGNVSGSAPNKGGQATFGRGSLIGGLALNDGSSSAGNFSGCLITLDNSASAQVYNLILPHTAGTAGQYLTSQGGGTSAMTWTTPPVATPVTVQSSIVAAVASPISVPATTTTSIVAQAVTMPVSGGPWRVIVSYNLNCLNGVDEMSSNVWVSDGTNIMAGSQAGAAVSSFNYGHNASQVSPVTYANGATVTFTMFTNSNKAFTVNTTPFSTFGQSSGMSLTVVPSL